MAASSVFGANATTIQSTLADFASEDMGALQFLVVQQKWLDLL